MAGFGTSRDVFDYYPRFRRLRDYIHRHIDEPLSLKEAAGIVGLQPNYFCGSFHKLVGMTFSQWLRECRVNQAKELLADRHMLISEVAYSVGYRDLTTFERAFRRIEGVTPVQYRKVTAPRRRFEEDVEA